MLVVLIGREMSCGEGLLVDFVPALVPSPTEGKGDRSRKARVDEVVKISVFTGYFDFIPTTTSSVCSVK